MFRLTQTEWQAMRSQFVTASQKKRNTYITPYAFTEHGVAMLSSILKSDKAITMNIEIMRVFIDIRRVLLLQNDYKEHFKEIFERLNEHDFRLNSIYEAMENLLDEKNIFQKWEEREMIGFITQNK